MQKMSGLDMVGFILLVVGGVNWGLVGFFDYNLVDMIFGVGSTITRVVYSLVGLSALWMLYMSSKMGKS